MGAKCYCPPQKYLEGVERRRFTLGDTIRYYSAPEVGVGVKLIPENLFSCD